jgi:signal transduction histidine kinase
MMGLIGQEPLTGLQRVNLSLAEGSTHAVLKLIDNALDFSNLQKDGLRLESHPVQTRQFIGEITQLFEVPAKAKGLELDGVIDAGVPDFFSTDPARLRQILSHLLSNAIKFTTTGRVGIQVSLPPRRDNATPTADGSLKLAFIVRDTGPGIPLEDLELLFQPHVQSGPTSGLRPGGTGLGLPISRRLAQLLGGDIRVASQPGQGSTFTLEVLVEAVETGD